MSNTLQELSAYLARRGHTASPLIGGQPSNAFDLPVARLRLGSEQILAEAVRGFTRRLAQAPDAALVAEEFSPHGDTPHRFIEVQFSDDDLAVDIVATLDHGHLTVRSGETTIEVVEGCIYQTGAPILDPEQLVGIAAVVLDDAIPKEDA